MREWSKDDRSLDVVIIGGSLSGLMHGVMIKRMGHNVRVLEQTTSTHREGYAAGMTIGPQGRNFFNQYDLVASPFHFDCPGFQSIDKHDGTVSIKDDPLYLTSWSSLYYRLRALYDGWESPYCPEPPPLGGKALFEQGAKVIEVKPEKAKLAVIVDDVNNVADRTIRADIVIDASGPYSLVRKQMLPSLSVQYAGFIAWRGTVPEENVSEQTRTLFDKRFLRYSCPGVYMIGYAVPGANGTTERGKRLINWIMYTPKAEGSAELTRIMTDSSGMEHRNTVPGGQIDSSVWAEQRAFAATCVSPAFLELMNATEKPFVATIREGYASRRAFLSNRLFLVGDGSNLMRPTAGMNANNSATQCLLLRQVLEGKMTAAEWEREALAAGWYNFLFSRLIGDYFLFGWLAFILTAIQVLLHLSWRRTSALWQRRFEL